MEWAGSWQVGQADYSAYAGERGAEDGADSVSPVGRVAGTKQGQHKALPAAAEPEQYGLSGDYGCSVAGTDDHGWDGILLATQVRLVRHC